ncbi:protein of unknown function DUF262 [Vibrio phage 1.121.O._10N.286.46.C4]|nr:protein of unknown function DUF262 [Vibrio phage 1.121.O._10N.286.46.C4]
MQTMNTKDLQHHLRSNVFSKEFYEVSAPLSRGMLAYLTYTKSYDYGAVYSNSEIFEAVPDFQRDNNKWTTEMQVSFVENVMRGFRTDIKLFEIHANGLPTKCSCMILDGLQRLTALHEFFEGNIKPFGYTFEELKADRLIANMSGGMVSVRVYNFSSKNEAIDFYVAMNENITHSPQDIEKALQHKE